MAPYREETAWGLQLAIILGKAGCARLAVLKSCCYDVRFCEWNKWTTGAYGEIQIPSCVKCVHMVPIRE